MLRLAAFTAFTLIAARQLLLMTHASPLRSLVLSALIPAATASGAEAAGGLGASHAAALAGAALVGASCLVVLVFVAMRALTARAAATPLPLHSPPAPVPAPAWWIRCCSCWYAARRTPSPQRGAVDDGSWGFAVYRVFSRILPRPAAWWLVSVLFRGMQTLCACLLVAACFDPHDRSDSSAAVSDLRNAVLRVVGAHTDAQQAAAMAMVCNTGNASLHAVFPLATALAAQCKSPLVLLIGGSFRLVRPNPGQVAPRQLDGRLVVIQVVETGPATAHARRLFVGASRARNGRRRGVHAASLPRPRSPPSPPPFARSTVQTRTPMRGLRACPPSRRTTPGWTSSWACPSRRAMRPTPRARPLGRR